MMKTAMARLNGHGDVEDGGRGGHEQSDHPLQFFRVKPGTRDVSLGAVGSSHPVVTDGDAAAVKGSLIVSSLVCMLVFFGSFVRYLVG